MGMRAWTEMSSWGGLQVPLVSAEVKEERTWLPSKDAERGEQPRGQRAKSLRNRCGLSVRTGKRKREQVDMRWGD